MQVRNKFKNYYLWNILNIENIFIYFTVVKVEGRKANFEIDSGAAVNIMSKSTYPC